MQDGKGEEVMLLVRKQEHLYNRRQYVRMVQDAVDGLSLFEITDKYGLQVKDVALTLVPIYSSVIKWRETSRCKILESRPTNYNYSTALRSTRLDIAQQDMNALFNSYIGGASVSELYYTYDMKRTVIDSVIEYVSSTVEGIQHQCATVALMMNGYLSAESIGVHLGISTERVLDYVLVQHVSEGRNIVLPEDICELMYNDFILSKLSTESIANRYGLNIVLVFYAINLRRIPEYFWIKGKEAKECTMV